MGKNNFYKAICILSVPFLLAGCEAKSDNSANGKSTEIREEKTAMSDAAATITKDKGIEDAIAQETSTVDISVTSKFNKRKHYERKEFTHHSIVYSLGFGNQRRTSSFQG